MTDGMNACNRIKHQKHYEQYAIQPIEFIGANGLDFFQGNIIKYVLRYKEKNGLEDLAKAKHYLDMLISLQTTGKVIIDEEPQD